MCKVSYAIRILLKPRSNLDHGTSVMDYGHISTTYASLTDHHKAV